MSTSIFRRRLIQAFALSTLCGMKAIAAEPFPNRPIKFVVPLPAGGTADAIARHLAEGMAKYLNQSVVVENRSGGGSSIGAAAVARAQPDGYTVLVGSGTTHSVLPAVMKSLPYDPQRDLDPILVIGSSSYVFVTRANFPSRTFKEFLSYVRDHPGAVSFGSFGAGSASHLGLLLLQLKTKTELLHVPYRGGAPVLQALLAGEIDSAVLTADQAELINSGKVQGLAILGPRRLGPLPAIPTAEEVGVAGWSVPVWNGLFVPEGTPLDRREKLLLAARESLSRPEMAKFFQTIGYEAVAENNPQVLEQSLLAEREKISSIVSASGLPQQ